MNSKECFLRVVGAVRDYCLHVEADGCKTDGPLPATVIHRQRPVPIGMPVLHFRLNLWFQCLSGNDDGNIFSRSLRKFVVENFVFAIS